MVGEQTALQYARVVAKTVNQVLQRDFQMMVRNALSSWEWQALKAAQEARNFPLINKVIGHAVHRATAEAFRDAGSPMVYRTLGHGFMVKTTQGGKYVIELTTRSQVAVKFANAGSTPTRWW